MSSLSCVRLDQRENVTLLCRKSRLLKRESIERTDMWMQKKWDNKIYFILLYYYTIIIESYGLKSQCRWLRGQVNGNSVKFCRCGAMNRPKVHSR